MGANDDREKLEVAIEEVIQAERELASLRDRTKAMCRLLVDAGHLTPAGVRWFERVLDERNAAASTSAFRKFREYKLGDLDDTPRGSDACAIENYDEWLFCTRSPGHGGNHAVGNGIKIISVWENK